MGALRVNGFWQCWHNICSPLPSLFIKLRCALKDWAVVLLIPEKSSVLMFYLTCELKAEYGTQQCVGASTAIYK